MLKLQLVYIKESENKKDKNSKTPIVMYNALMLMEYSNNFSKGVW